MTLQQYLYQKLVIYQPDLLISEIIVIELKK